MGTKWPTFILDLANNHGGDLAAGLEIVKAVGGVVKEYGVNAALKLQYRDNERFEHGDAAYQEKFKKTALGWSDYRMLAQATTEYGMRTACTPFDVNAVAQMKSYGFTFTKIASCSATDWPTIEAAADLGKPMIFSTANLSWDDVDNLVSFAQHRGVEFALMHCVAIYPMPRAAANLSRIAQMRERYPGVEIGWSTHEDPSDMGLVQMAYAYGARIFECHVGKVNAYSRSPEELGRWFEAHDSAVLAHRAFGYEEQEAAALARVERKRHVDPPAFAHPLKLYVHRTKASLAIAGIALPPEFTVDFSHHYGLPHFNRFGAVLITCVNRAYCKKLLVVQAGQEHPSHYHKIKEETFQVLHGELWMDVDGHERILRPGELLTVLPGQWHSFMGRANHTIFEEISTEALPNDSVYRDPAINANDNRKTSVKNWGRFELA